MVFYSLTFRTVRLNSFQAIKRNMAEDFGTKTGSSPGGQVSHALITTRPQTSPTPEGSACFLANGQSIDFHDARLNELIAFTYL